MVSGFFLCDVRENVFLCTVKTEKRQQKYHPKRLNDMKRLMTTLAVMVMMVASAAAMSFSKARNEALFLTDKMAYELSLSLEQYEAVYEINLDYLLTLHSPTDLGGVYWIRRNSDLRYVLNAWQWNAYCSIVDFYRPMSWMHNSFTLGLRTRYTNQNQYYYYRPSAYGTYQGGHNTRKESYYANRNYGAPSTPNHPRDERMSMRNNLGKNTGRANEHTVNAIPSGRSSRGASAANQNSNRVNGSTASPVQDRSTVNGNGRANSSSRSAATTTSTPQSSGAANGSSRRGNR